MNYCQLSDEIWMCYAVTLASFAECYGEVSVGAVLVLDERIIGMGWNSSISLHDPTAHAEIIALRQGGKVIGNYRLLRTTLYVTLEPCIMCLGAMIHARIFRLVFGAQDKKHSFFIFQKKLLNILFIKHRILYQGGVLKYLCSQQILNFFRRKRFKKIV